MVSIFVCTFTLWLTSWRTIALHVTAYNALIHRNTKGRSQGGVFKKLRRPRPAAFIYAGQKYDLSHTRPACLSGKSLNTPEGIRVRCIMSCHCFTQAAPTDTKANYQYEGEDRIFSPNRYEQSKQILPHFKKALTNAARYKVISTRDATGNSNFLTLDTPEDGLRYCMYFDLQRKIDSEGTYILLHIRSAYMKRISYSSKQKVRLGTLIDEILGLKQKVRRKRRKRR